MGIILCKHWRFRVDSLLWECFELLIKILFGKADWNINDIFQSAFIKNNWFDYVKDEK